MMAVGKSSLMLGQGSSVSFSQSEHKVMSQYEDSKKARRIAAVLYLLIMAGILTGTYFSEQQKEAARATQSKTPPPNMTR
jgi:hypothetical protein